MKHCFYFLLACCIFSGRLVAQNAHHTHLLMLTIHSGTAANHPEIVVTNENGQQSTPLGKQHWLLKESATKLVGFKHKDLLPQNEDSLYQLLKPYFDQGWTLTSTEVLEGRGVGPDPGDDLLTRYFFTRQD